jgi:hypothetical protein
VDGVGIGADIIGSGVAIERPDRVEATAVHGYPIHITASDRRRSGPTGSDARRGRVTASDAKRNRMTTSEEP